MSRKRVREDVKESKTEEIEAICPLTLSRQLHGQMKQKLEQIAGLKKKGTVDEVKLLLSEFRTAVLALKEANRELFLQTEMKKNQTQLEKDRINQLGLQLQNYLYESDHLKKEIRT